MIKYRNPTHTQDGSISTILVIILLLIGVGTGAYLAGTKKGDPSSPIPPNTIPSSNQITIANSTPKPTITPTPSIDEMASWKTYTSSTISFKYPPSLTLEERQKNYLVLLSQANNPQSVLVSIDIRKSGSYSNYDEAVISAKTDLIDAQATNITNGIKISGKLGPGYGQGQSITKVIFKSGPAGIGIETTTTRSADLETFNQIISTITF